MDPRQGTSKGRGTSPQPGSRYQGMAEFADEEPQNAAHAAFILQFKLYEKNWQKLIKMAADDQEKAAQKKVVKALQDAARVLYEIARENP